MKAIYTIIFLHLICLSFCQQMRGPSDAFCIQGFCLSSCEDDNCLNGGSAIISCTSNVFGGNKGLHCYKPAPGQYCVFCTNDVNYASLKCNKANHSSFVN